MRARTPAKPAKVTDLLHSKTFLQSLSPRERMAIFSGIKSSSVPGSPNSAQQFHWAISSNPALPQPFSESEQQQNVQCPASASVIPAATTTVATWQLVRMHNRLAASLAHSERLLETNTELQEEKEQLHNRVAMLQQQVASLAARQDVKAASSERLQALESVIKGLKDSMSQVQSMAARVTHENKVLLAEIQQFATERARHLRTIEQLQARVSDLEVNVLVRLEDSSKAAASATAAAEEPLDSLITPALVAATALPPGSEAASSSSSGNLHGSTGKIGPALQEIATLQRAKATLQRETATLQQQLSSAERNAQAAAAVAAAERARAGKALSQAQQRLAAAVQRLAHMAGREQQHKATVKEREAYITRLEKCLLEQNRQLQQLTAGSSLVGNSLHKVHKVAAAKRSNKHDMAAAAAESTTAPSACNARCAAPTNPAMQSANGAVDRLDSSTVAAVSSTALRLPAPVVAKHLMQDDTHRQQQASDRPGCAACSATAHPQHVSLPDILTAHEKAAVSIADAALAKTSPQQHQQQHTVLAATGDWVSALNGSKIRSRGLDALAEGDVLQQISQAAAAAQAQMAQQCKQVMLSEASITNSHNSQQQGPQTATAESAALETLQWEVQQQLPPVSAELEERQGQQPSAAVASSQTAQHGSSSLPGSSAWRNATSHRLRALSQLSPSGSKPVSKTKQQQQQEQQSASKQVSQQQLMHKQRQQRLKELLSQTHHLRPAAIARGTKGLQQQQRQRQQQKLQVTQQAQQQPGRPQGSVTAIAQAGDQASLLCESDETPLPVQQRQQRRWQLQAAMQGAACSTDIPGQQQQYSSGGEFYCHHPG